LGAPRRPLPHPLEIALGIEALAGTAPSPDI